MAKYQPAALLRAAGGNLWPLAIPVAAYQAGRAPSGEKLAAAETSMVNSFLLPAAKFAAGMALGGPLAGLAATFIPTPAIERSIYGGFRMLSQIDRRVHRLECGGHYRDTETARALRLRAMSEMSGAMGSARRLLGREAEYLHQ